MLAVYQDLDLRTYSMTSQMEVIWEHRKTDLHLMEDDDDKESVKIICYGESESDDD